MQWDELTMRIIPLGVPQIFGAWLEKDGHIEFCFNENCTPQEWLVFDIGDSNDIVHMQVKEGAVVKIIEHLPYVYYDVQANASVTHISKVHSCRLTFKLDENACLWHASGVEASDTYDEQIMVTLNAPRASVDWKERIFLQKGSIYQSTLKIEHGAPNTRSNCYIKSVVEDNCFFKFVCDVIIQKEAEHTVAHQRNLNYILGKKGRVVAQPQLRIFNKHIEASHGTATQPIPQSALFYLQTHGLPQLDAQKLFLSSFLQDCFDGIVSHEME